MNSTNNIELLIATNKLNYDMIRNNHLDWISRMDFVDMFRNAIIIPSHGELIDRTALHKGPHFEMVGEATVDNNPIELKLDTVLMKDIDSMSIIVPSSRKICMYKDII